MFEHTIWSKIGQYLVSANGEMISLGERPGRLKPIINHDGYAIARLYYKETDKVISHRLHRLVAGFYIKGKKLPQINHKDGDKLNNRVENLEWATNSSNQLHAWEKGLQPRSQSSKPTLHALSKSQKEECRALRLEGLSYQKIADRYSVSGGTVRRVCLQLFKYEESV